MRNRRVTIERREGLLGDSWRELYLSHRGLWVVIEGQDGTIVSRAYRTEAAARDDFSRPLFPDEAKERAS